MQSQLKPVVGEGKQDGGEPIPQPWSLPQIKRKGTDSRPAWYVNDRLVVRLHDENTLVIRVPLTKRESLIETFPDTFGVPPRMEAHHKVEAYLDRAKPRAVRMAIDLAWEMQSR
jgi:hypothetical protein